MSKINLVSESVDYDKYLKINKGVFKDTTNPNEEKVYDRFALIRPEASTVLVYNTDEDTVVLVSQHRYPVQVHGKSEGDILEVPAGKIDEGESPEEAAIREVKEEVGYDIKEENLIFMSEYYPSPGYTTEVVHLFVVTVANEDKTSEGGGIESENENIKIHNVKSSDFLKMVSNGDIKDGKTIMAANALWHLRNGHFTKLGMQYYAAMEQQKSNEEKGEE